MNANTVQVQNANPQQAPNRQVRWMTPVVFAIPVVPMGPRIQCPARRFPITPLNQTVVEALREDFGFQICNCSLSGIGTPPMSRKLAVLIAEINAGKYRVGRFKRFFIWLKTLFSGNYNIEIAKLAFSKIKNKSILLDIASDYMDLPENAKALHKNVKILSVLMVTRQRMQLLSERT
ncbi:MAG: hypothetical protein LBD34_01480 [Puniceicoccales bacterium]|jgi:hypothetical protein|nr:hypothetical protein [Puniceicoccales bacterium]